MTVDDLRNLGRGFLTRVDGREVVVCVVNGENKDVSFHVRIAHDQKIFLEIEVVEQQ